MIQRKQTIYLFFSFILLSLAMFANFGQYSDARGIFELHFFGLLDVTNPDDTVVVFYTYPLISVTVLPLILVLVAIFLFKRRPLQMKICGIAAGLQLGLTAMLIVANKMFANDFELDWNFNFMALIPIASAVLSYLAYRAIDSDEALLRSLDRLR